jgi:hypothetical protein
MNRLFRLIFVLTGIGLLAHAEPKRPAAQTARTVYFPDGSRTESVIDIALREQTEITYSAQGVKIARKVYLLNEQGLATQGNIYDGRDTLKARAQFLFDEFGRMAEQRMLNLQGEIFQRILFTYDKNGNQQTPKSYNYAVKAPDMKSAPIDLTKPQGQPMRMDRSQGDPTYQGNVPMLPDGAGAGGLPPITMGMDNKDPNATSGEKKKGFFGRMFGKKDKDAKK